MRDYTVTDQGDHVELCVTDIIVGYGVYRSSDVVHPLYRARKGRMPTRAWQEYLSPTGPGSSSATALDVFDKVVGPVITPLGYYRTATFARGPLIAADLHHAKDRWRAAAAGYGFHYSEPARITALVGVPGKGRRGNMLPSVHNGRRLIDCLWLAYDTCLDHRLGLWLATMDTYLKMPLEEFKGRLAEHMLARAAQAKDAG